MTSSSIQEPDEQGRVWIDPLELWIGPCDEWVAWYDKHNVRLGMYKVVMVIVSYRYAESSFGISSSAISIALSNAAALLQLS